MLKVSAIWSVLNFNKRKKKVKGNCNLQQNLRITRSEQENGWEVSHSECEGGRKEKGIIIFIFT